MRQTIHIFKKDLRRFSWEIAATLILLGVYAWCQPASWQPLDMFFAVGGGSAFLRYQGSMVLGLFLVVAWTILLVRLVQEESLAGDKQFWVTRPYCWPSLLAAKVLFVIVVVNLPLLIVQLGLLRAAGFAPFHHPDVLLFINLGLDAIFLPFAALAAISGSRTQLTRVAIVALILMIAWLALGSSGFSVSWHGTRAWSWLGEVILFGVPLVVIVRQYAWRKTVQSRWILLGGALALVLLSAVEPKSTLNEAKYPVVSSQNAYIQLHMERPPESQTPRPILTKALTQADRYVAIDLDLYGDEVADGSVVEGNAVRVTLQAADGTQWDSGWERVFNVMEHNQPGTETSPPVRDTRRFNALFLVDKNFFDRYKDAPISVHVTAAATLFRDHAEPIDESEGSLILPGIGFCRATERPVSLYMYTCRTDRASIPLLGITSRRFRSCPASPDELLRPPDQSTAWTGGGETIERLSPVLTFTPYLQRDETKPQSFAPCNDAPLLFRQPEEVRKFRVEKDFKDVKLADFVRQL
ncbi:MAG TPA: hypothetical protein VIB39_20045 [Candidatus Angelobacter sp.]|jgi:hypothetical protein